MKPPKPETCPTHSFCLWILWLGSCNISNGDYRQIVAEPAAGVLLLCKAPLRFLEILWPSRCDRFLSVKGLVSSAARAKPWGPNIWISRPLNPKPQTLNPQSTRASLTAPGKDELLLFVDGCVAK